MYRQNQDIFMFNGLDTITTKLTVIFRGRERKKRNKRAKN